jgi:hypothetical protein
LKGEDIMGYKRTILALALLFFQLIFSNTKTLNPLNQVIVLNFKTLNNETPLDNYLVLKVFNETFSEIYEIINGEVRIPYYCNSLNASIIWVPFNRTIRELGRILNMTLEPITLNVKNFALRCNVSNVDVSKIKLYLVIFYGNQSKTWRMYKGTFNLTIPNDIQLNYSILYPFFGKNFTVSAGMLNIENRKPLKLNVTDIKGMHIRLNKPISDVLIELVYDDNSLFTGEVNENGFLEINSSQIIPTCVENCYWLALYGNRGVGKRSFNSSEREIVLSLNGLHLAALSLIDSDGESVGFNELEIYLNGTILKKPLVPLINGNYVLMIKLRVDSHKIDITTNMTNILINQDCNITARCDVRRIRGMQVKWLIGVLNNKPVFLQYSDGMLIPFGTFSMYSDNRYLGYLNNSRAELRVVRLQEGPIIEYEPGLMLNMPILIILQILSLILMNILLIKWYKSKKERYKLFFKLDDSCQSYIATVPTFFIWSRFKQFV